MTIPKTQSQRLLPELFTEDGLMTLWLDASDKGYHDSLVLDRLNWNDRLKRLFAVSCCRGPAVWPWLTDDRSRNAVGVAERFADGLATEQERRAAAHAAYDAAYDAAAYAAYNAVAYAAAYAAHVAYASRQEYQRQGKVLIAMVRPEWEFDASWRTETVVGIAEEVYRLRAWDRLPILADALEDAGCDDSRILTWAREGDLWFKGEWLVDQARGVRD